MTTAVHIAAATKRYGNVEAVRDISLSLGQGEITALVGHNGAGKTTLIKLMLGLIRPTTGTVRVLGEDPATGDTSVRRRLGYLPESVSFHMALTGRETLAFYARLKRVDVRAATDLFDQVGLSAASADRPICTYSKGMRQRLGLAQALLGQPQLLLLDEPTSGLDPALRRNFWSLIAELRSRGTTILLSSHALTELEDRADRVVIINGGTKIADGTLDELRGIARLPSRISLRLTEGTTAAWHNKGVVWRRNGDAVLEAEVAPENKIALLHEVTLDPSALAGLALMEPTLDDLYAHFLKGQETRL